MIQVLENTLTAYPLEALRLAPENTRQEADPTALEDLKASIREQGLLQNLVGYREGDQVFVVAGGHRLRALQALAEEGFPVPPVPVRLIPKDRALIYSATENLARKDLTPLEEARVVAQVVEALGLEGASRELGRSRGYLESRYKVARKLHPNWQEALNRREISFLLADLLADLPEGDQERLFQEHGTRLRPETVKAFLLKEAVPASRLLPGVLERYQQEGGVIHQDLEGNQYLGDRALALRLQEEAARKLAERLQAELHLDLPLHQIKPASPGTPGKNLVVLQTSTFEVRTFLNILVRGGGEEKEASKPQAATPRAHTGTDGQPTSQKTSTPSTTSAGAPAVTKAGAVERVALTIRAYREWAAQDPKRLQAAVVAAMASVLALGPHANMRFRDLTAFHREAALIGAQRFHELSGERQLRTHFQELLGTHLNQVTVEHVLSLPEPVQEEAFRIALSLLLALPQTEEPIRPTLGMADAKHLTSYRKDLLEQAAKDLGLAPGKNRKDTAARLLERASVPFPDLLWQA